MECGVQYCLLQASFGRTTSIYRGTLAEPGEEPVPKGTRPEKETEEIFEKATASPYSPTTDPP
jgi:hypothetical protein